jgi:hypothetical protein
MSEVIDELKAENANLVSVRLRDVARFLVPGDKFVMRLTGYSPPSHFTVRGGVQGSGIVVKEGLESCHLSHLVEMRNPRWLPIAKAREVAPDQVRGSAVLYVAPAVDDTHDVEIGDPAAWDYPGVFVLVRERKGMFTVVRPTEAYGA